MTYTIVTPNAGQSPGVFPAQANTNFQRLYDIINNDHFFTNSASASQGIHKQCTMINRADPVGLPAGNGIIYSKADTNGNAQLNWYNGNSIVQITPGSQMLTGTTASLPGGDTEVVFADPGYAYSALAWCIESGGTTQRRVSMVSLQTGAVTNVMSLSGSTVSFQYTGSDLEIINGGGSAKTYVWTLQINRLL